MNKNDLKFIAAFENIKEDEKIISSTIKIQNSINIYADSKVIAVSVAKDDISVNIIARTLAEMYAFQNQSTLLLDCNMYTPTLNNAFNINNIEIGLNNIINEDINIDKLVNHITDNLDVVFSCKTVYPTEVFKSKNYIDFISSMKDKYQHIIIIMPSIAEHRDILINKELFTAALLVARKNKVSKKDLYDSIQVLESNNIPYVGTIYVK